jgi:hypothetical protein
MKTTPVKEKGKKLVVSVRLASSSKKPPALPASKAPFMDEINRRAEVMTPCLQGILDNRPAPRWHR